MSLHDHEQDHHRGLAVDLGRLGEQALQRRGALRWLASAGALGLIGCGGGGDSAGSASAATIGTTGTTGTTGTGTTIGTSTGTTTGTSTGTGTTTAVSNCSVIPEETVGPYPGDGSNAGANGIANALALSGIVRSDIRSSIGSASAIAGGVPLTVKLRIVNTNGNCADLAGYAVYLWHCDREGRYSMYSGGVTGENYLRGVQPTDSAGLAAFTTIYPGCYSGRVPHIHFEVYRSSTTATSFSNKLKTSQLTFPTATSSEVYAVAGYEASVRNNAAISVASDNVFSDGATLQIASVTGSVAAGYVAALTVGISV